MDHKNKLTKMAYELWSEYFSHHHWKNVSFVFTVRKRINVKWMIRYGMQDLVTEENRRYIVHITMSEKHAANNVSAAKVIMHELYHVDQIIKGELKFDGMTYIYNGVRYPLKFQFDGSYMKNQKNALYFRGSRHSVPWESMSDFMDNLADKYLQRKAG